MAKSLPKKESITRETKDRFLSNLKKAGVSNEQLALVAAEYHGLHREKGTRASSHRVQIAEHADFATAFEAVEVAMNDLNKLLRDKKFKLKKRGSQEMGIPCVDVKVEIKV
jgi:hypothetical protein|tara:strand:+ start:373 stop:705 length:333 start_codon:yes stop_codon:yes gene_type:complete